MNKFYRFIVQGISPWVPHRMKPMWEHPAGPQTIHFWAPLFKWSLVIAGLGDLTRPADKISTSQAGALAATGLIWSRYSLVIIPKNWSLFSVNVFVFITNSIQLGRAIQYNQSVQAEQKAIEAPKKK